MRDRRFEELDALRGIAALAVVIYHFTRYVTDFHNFGDFPGPFAIGERGVQLFFLVSGFVIYYTIQRSKTLADFAFSRFTRLYPTYWISLMLWGAFSLFVLERKLWITGYVANATMLQSFIGVYDLNAAYWTLAVELVFYAWIALLFAAGHIHRITLFCTTWLTLSFAWGVAGNFYELPQFISTYLILEHAPYFAAGIMFRRIQLDGWKMPYVAILAFALVDNAVINGISEVIASLVFFTTFGLAIGGKLRWICTPVLLWLGAISYSLYVTHLNLGFTALQWLHDSGIASWVSVPLVACGSLALASAVTYWLERPAINWLRQWRERRPLGFGTLAKVREE